MNAFKKQKEEGGAPSAFFRCDPVLDLKILGEKLGW